MNATSSADAGWKLEATYATLPEIFFSEVMPTPVQAPRLLALNEPLAAVLGLTACSLRSAGGVAVLAGNAVPASARPIAQAYAGHQFGHFTTLGDGRAILLGEQVTPEGMRRDIQWKGAGPTPYSRRGDGRAAVGPMLREYLISEAMAALGVPTTRCLAVVATGEPVYRDRPLPGAVLTRVAASHIRVGTFEWAGLSGDPADLRAICRYTIVRHYPEVEESSHPARALFEAICRRQAALVASWQGLGFIHGVMNTDNMALSGETIDYGPCAFMDVYDPATVFSSIDHRGRYAYQNQPRIAQWNLARLAEAMLPLFDPNPEASLAYANATVEAFGRLYEEQWRHVLRAKVGLIASEEAEDSRLLDDLLDAMQRAELDWTNTFAGLAEAHEGGTDIVSSEWSERWRDRLSRQPLSPSELRQALRATNPKVIPRNHKVEEALKAASETNDLRPFERLLQILRNPFQAGIPEEFLSPMPGGRGNYQTFCGT